MRGKRSVFLLVISLLILIVSAISGAGCLAPDLKELNPCLVSGVIDEVDVKKLERVDLLFVIDNSGSMQEEQAKLRKELPRMIKILTSGDLDPDDNGGVLEENKDFPAAKDLHLAVVTTDMGLPGVQTSMDVAKCPAGSFGDDGVFQNLGNQADEASLSCQASYPPFLSFQQEYDDPNAIAEQFQCITALGAGGCGFEMQLEAPLKALWPAEPGNLEEEQKGQNILFLGNSPPHGDQQHLEFLRGTRYHPSQSEHGSLLAIILVTDEEDCSAGARGNLHFLEHSSTAPAGIAQQAANLRCYYDDVNDQGNKFPVERYIKAFKALRPGREKQVIFAAIAGIPSAIPGMNSRTDGNGDGRLDDRDPLYWDADGNGAIDADDRASFYQAVYRDPMMQETINATGDKLSYSCTLPNRNYDPGAPEGPDNDPHETAAYPARRITRVAEGFEENGIVESICQESFTGAMDSIIRAISQRLGGRCLPRKLKRDSAGKVNCDVFWLMPEGQGCGHPFLNQPPPDQPQQKNGRILCVVDQVPVIDTTTTDPLLALEPGKQGWYYDDFTVDRLKDCKGDNPDDKQRLAFTVTATAAGEVTADPPAEAIVELQCLDQVQSIIGSEESAADRVGEVCGADADCGPTPPMMCHPRSRTCVIACSSNAECPAAWACDLELESAFAHSAGFPICVNPTCGD